MGMRAGRLGCFVALALVGAACGGGGDDDEQAVDAEVAPAGGPVVEVDPCELLDRQTAAALSGGDVAEADGEPPRPSIASTIGCSYRRTDGGGGDGDAIAASLVLAAADDEPDAAKDARVAALTSALDDPAVEALDLGDAAALVTTDEVVVVVYVVEEVVVSVEVAPVDGVDEEAVEAVVEFTGSTVEPVREAFEAKARADADADADDTGSPEDGDDEAASGEAVVQGEIEGLWTGDWGTMAIEVDGDEVRAAYTHDDGRISGTFEDGVFRGRWTEVPTRVGPNDAGEVEFRFAKSGDGTIALDGRWDYDGDPEPLGHDDWDLTLSTDDVPPELLEAFDDEASFEEP